MRGYWHQVHGAGLLVGNGVGPVMHGFDGNTGRTRFGGSGEFRGWTVQDLLRYRSVSAVEQTGLKKGEEDEGESGEEKEEGELEEGEISMDEMSCQGAVGEETQAMEMDCLPSHTTKYSLDSSNESLWYSESWLETPTLVTDCIKVEPLEVYSAYQNKFRNDDYERLPSPTPEDRCGKDDEVLSALGSLNTVKYSVQGLNTVATPADVSCGIKPTSDTPCYAELRQPQHVVENFCVEATGGKPVECKSKLNVCFEVSNQDCPASKRQRSGLTDTNSVREMNFNMGIQLKPRDPRRAFFDGTLHSTRLPVRCSEDAETNKNINEQILEGEVTMKSVSPHVTTPDITRLDTENLKDADTMTSSLSEDISSETSEKQSTASKSGTKWSDVKHLFDEFDDHQIAEILKERERRLEEQKKMFAEHKLCLVLDLDHTLLNSAKFSEIDQVHEEMLKWNEKQEREKPYRHLFCLPHMAMWTKLRPGIWKFLEKASKLCELHLCTMGNKLYASEMAKILDPEGVLFAGRVISKGDDDDVIDDDDKVSKTKDLEGVLGMESCVLILDDCKSVWPHHRPNLIAVERYIYFPCSRWQFGLAGPSLLDIGRDERPEDGALASILAVIERLHETFFSHGDLDTADVRVILADEKSKILSGCRIVFSHVFPVAEVNPHLHPLWKLAEQLGASCTNRIDEEVTHVVANSPGTEKVKWALSNGKFVVRPNWVEASALLYRRANEQDFAIKP